MKQKIHVSQKILALLSGVLSFAIQARPILVGGSFGFGTFTEQVTDSTGNPIEYSDGPMVVKGFVDRPFNNIFALGVQHQRTVGFSGEFTSAIALTSLAVRAYPWGPAVWGSATPFSFASYSGWNLMPWIGPAVGLYQLGAESFSTYGILMMAEAGMDVSPPQWPFGIRAEINFAVIGGAGYFSGHSLSLGGFYAY